MDVEPRNQAAHRTERVYKDHACSFPDPTYNLKTMAYYNLAPILVLVFASAMSYAASSHHVCFTQYSSTYLDTDRSAQGGSQIQWGACDPTVVNDTSLSCGFLQVPLDYHDPSVGHARLAVIKANATGERRGSVFFNPGQLRFSIAVRNSLTRRPL